MHRLPRESAPGDDIAPAATHVARLTRGRWLTLGFLTWLTIAAGLAVGEESKNLILIVVEDLGAGDLACQGSPRHETPNIDRLAVQGALFTHAYAAAAIGSPSKASLRTGRYPVRIGITDQIDPRTPRPEDPAMGEHASAYRRGPREALETPVNPPWMEHGEVTLAEILQDAGYATGFIGEWDLGVGGDGDGDGDGRGPEYRTVHEADEAVAFLRAHADRPFFLDLTHHARRESSLEKSAYAARIEQVDQAVGRVLDTVEELDLMDRTLVLLTSDNGTPLPIADNAPLRAGKGSPYEGGVRVPLIARLPSAIAAGSVCRTPVSGIDVLPTVCAALGVDSPADVVVDGVDFIRLLAATGDALPRPLFWHFPHYFQHDRSSVTGPYSVVRLGDWKLIRIWEGLRHELYDLETDASESADIAIEHPDTVARLTRLLDQHLLSTAAKLPRAPIPPGATEYMGRRIAQTMHWEGSEWLLRETREEEEHASKLLALLGIQPGWTVCDLGVGSGYHALPIADMVGPSGRVLGVDIQPEMLFFLDERARQAAIENIHLILGELHDPRLPAESCDLVLMVDVYHELSHPQEVLRAIRRALRPGGRLALVEFRAEDPAVPIKALHKMSKEQMRGELEANGFRVAEEHDSLPWQHVMLFAVTVD